MHVLSQPRHHPSGRLLSTSPHLSAINPNMLLKPQRGPNIHPVISATCLPQQDVSKLGYLLTSSELKSHAHHTVLHVVLHPEHITCLVDCPPIHLLTRTINVNMLFNPSECLPTVILVSLPPVCLNLMVKHLRAQTTHIILCVFKTSPHRVWSIAVCLTCCPRLDSI